MNKENWNGKKVFVTGGHGFVGQNLMKILERMRQQVDFDILCPTSSEVDLTNESEVDSYFADNRPDIVLHLAGKVGGIAANKAAPAISFIRIL